jgi:site-specific DNA-methyltransferase (adenine-specific)
LDISKSLDRAVGASRKVIGANPNHPPHSGVGYGGIYSGGNTGAALLTAPASPEAVAWAAYGTALKPAWEPVVLAMAPLAGTFAENAQQHGVAGLNIGGARIPANGDNLRGGSISSRRKGWDRPWKADEAAREAALERSRVAVARAEAEGRWPANAIFVHRHECGAERCAPSCQVAELEHQSGNLSSGFMAAGTQREGVGWRGNLGREVRHDTIADSGPASRFFYCAKVSPSERGGSEHPTLKPVDLTAYLAKLLLPPARNGEPRHLMVPFSGAGSEIIGALRVGWEAVIGIELDPQHAADSERRIRADAPLLNDVQVVELEPLAATGEAR